MAKKHTAGTESGGAGAAAQPARRRSAPSRRRSSLASAVETGNAPAEAVTALDATPSAADHTPDHDEIARVAYSYWEARGRRGGSPEDDWHRAEQELRRQRALQARA